MRGHASGWILARTKETHLADLKMLRDALTEKGWREGLDLRCTVVPGAEHNERAWAARFGDVLQYLFPRDGSPGEPG